MARATRLLHHPSERFNVARLLNSTLRPGGNNNDINVLQGENIQPISDPWLTDPDAWFLIGSPDDIDVRFYWRDQPDTTTWDDQNTDATFHKIRQRHGVGFGDWRGVYGSPGA